MNWDMEVTEKEHVSYADILNRTENLLEHLKHRELNPVLIAEVKELIEAATESGYFGGYSDAHWYMRGMEDGA